MGTAAVALCQDWLSLFLLYLAAPPHCSTLLQHLILKFPDANYPLHLNRAAICLFLVLSIFPFYPSLVLDFGLTCPWAHLASGPPAFCPPVPTSPCCLCAPRSIHHPSCQCTENTMGFKTAAEASFGVSGMV